MNVQANNLAFVFGPELVCGKVVLVLWPHDVYDPLGHRWVVRIRDEGECVLPDASLMAMNVDPRFDPGARELLDDSGKQAWDRWFSPPDINF